MLRVRPTTALMLFGLGCPAAALLAQDGSSLQRLSFMTGCWEGPFGGLAGPGTIEERYTTPSSNVMLGTTRYLVGGRSTGFEFSLLTADSTGIALVPYPGGVRSAHDFRLTRVTADSAVFEAPEHDYPKRIIYRREPDGALVARIDAGAGDARPREWRMRSVACLPGLTLAAAPRVPAGPDRSGANEFIVFETLHGLWLGIAIPAMLGAEEATPIGLGLLVGGPLGFLVSKVYSDARPLSTGQARAILWGGEWGLWQAVGWGGAFSTDMSSETGLRLTVAGMAAGTIIGGFIARNPIAGGDASLVSHSSVWGTWYGIALGVIAGAEDDNLLRIALVTGNVALLGAAAATRGVDWSSGRVWLISAGGFAGLIAGLGVDILVRADNEKVGIGLPALTSFAGLAAVAAATRNTDQVRLGRDDRQPAGALVAVREGRLRFDLPIPAPALLPREDRDGTRRWVPGVRLTLFDLLH